MHQIKIFKGFTLIELMVAIGLVAILSTLGVSMIGTSSQKFTRDGRRQADLENIRSSLELYRNDNGKYPVTLNWETTLTGGNYIRTVPTDPKNSSLHYVYTGIGSCGSPAGACTYSLCTNASQPLEKTGLQACVYNP